MLQYINVYDINRQYGGPEEGGWWFDTGELIASLPVFNDENRQKIVDALLLEFGKTGKRYSVNGGSDYNIEIDDKPGENFPKEYPHYE